MSRARGDARDALERRPLFGGAVLVDVPTRFRDVSSVVPVPDHQEVFADGARDETLVVELVDAIAREGEDLRAFAFADACEAMEASSATYVRGRERARDDDARARGASETHVAYGVARVRRSRETSANDIDLWGGIVRVRSKRTDALIWHARPFAFDGDATTPGGERARPSDADAARAGVVECSDVLDAALNSFEIVDWGLFGDEDGEG